MSNEEHIEEMYWLAHTSGVFPEFRDEISIKLSENRTYDRCHIVESVFHKFIEEGLIEYRTETV
jgi:hypothetical protein